MEFMNVIDVLEVHLYSKEVNTITKIEKFKYES